MSHLMYMTQAPPIHIFFPYILLTVGAILTFVGYYLFVYGEWLLINPAVKKDAKKYQKKKGRAEIWIGAMISIGLILIISLGFHFYLRL